MKSSLRSASAGRSPLRRFDASSLRRSLQHRRLATRAGTRRGLPARGPHPRRRGHHPAPAPEPPVHPARLAREPRGDRAGDLRARLHGEAALGRLERWFDSIDVHGLGEWNSAAYYPIDLLALFSLHDLEPMMKERASRTLDRIFEMVALHTSGGVPGGSQGRCYEKELLAGPATELGPVASIAFGGEYWPGYDRAAALFCLSDYTPPDHLDQLARPGSAVLETRYTQGANHAGKLGLWKSRDGQLSTAAGGDVDAEGHQAHVIDVQLSSPPMARLWINHPGDRMPWGERRPSLLAGNHVSPAVAHSGPIAMLLYDLDRQWTDIHEGLYRGSLWRAKGPVTGWVVTMSRPRETAHEFTSRLGVISPALEERRLTCLGEDGRQVLQLNGAFSIDGKRAEFSSSSVVPEIKWTHSQTGEVI